MDASSGKNEEWPFEPVGKAPGKDLVAAKLVARSAEEIDPYRVGAHDRKTYLHAR